MNALRKWMARTKPDALLLSSDMDHLRLVLGNGVGMASMHRLSDDSRFAGIDQQHDLIASHACDLLIGQLGRNEFGVPAFPKTMLVEGLWREA